jgi:AcrR family transcriptional regulator
MRDGIPAENTRDAILDATDRMLAKYGYQKMTIEDLAREVGIGKGSIYLHFSSKEEIALSHIDRIISRLKARLTKIAGEPKEVEKRLSAMLCERVLFRFDSVQHYSQGLNDMLSRLRAKLLEHRRRHFEEEAQILADVIREGQESGVFADGDAVDLAHSLINATNSLLPYSLSAHELGDRTDIAERTQKTATLLIRGLRT